MASRREVLRELSFRKCKGTSEHDTDAFLYWARNYCKIQHPERGSIAFDLRPAQEEIITTWMIERYSIVLKARQIGWSTLVACYTLWLTFFWPDRIVVMLSKGDREAMQLLAKATYAYERMPPWMKARGPKRLTRNLKKLSFANASSIESLPSKEDPARGMTVTLVIVDEWASLENPEEAWASIEPISDVGGRVIGLSTAKGSGDFFHQFWVSAVTGVRPFKPMFYPWWANDERDEDWYATKKRTMLEWQLHQEYPSDAAEAFVKSGRTMFDLDMLDQIETREPVHGALDTLLNGMRHPQWDEWDDGPLEVWEFPDPNHAYVIGGDVAEGLDHGDFSCAYVIDIATGRSVACWHGHCKADQFGDRLYELGAFYNFAFIGVESNNHGLSTLHELQRLRYPSLYYRRSVDQRTKKMENRIGWSTNKQSKPFMIDELGKSLREEDLLIEDSSLIGELRTYVRDDKGQMHGSPFDDRVMAMAVANQMRTYQSIPEVEVDDSAPYWSFDYFVGLSQEEQEPMSSPMGAFNRRAEDAA
jgi:hypothetical protein